MFLDWVSKKIDRPCRLPTEEEWEFAARGMDRREYPFGERFEAEACNTIESGIGQTTPVDKYDRGVSPFGIYDMAGNVEEWTRTIYRPYLGGRFIEDDIATSCKGEYHVLRGGSFSLGGDLARCARRHGPHPDPQFRFRGFRVAYSD